MATKYTCQRTHQFIISGTCPWCHCHIADGQIVPDSRRPTPADRRWNIPALMEALDDEDLERRNMVVSNLLCHPLPADEALPVLRKALDNSEASVWLTATHALTRLGRTLSGHEAEKLEQEVQVSPNDLPTRIVLLGYYPLRATLFDSARQARQRHILWLIENAPGYAFPTGPDTRLDPSTDGEVYEQAKQLWLNHVQLNGQKPSLLACAAHYFAWHDRQLSEALLKKAQTLDPENPEWSKLLGRLYERGMARSTGKERREAAAQSLVELENARSHEATELGQYLLLPDLAKTAFDADELEKARAYATELLQKSEQGGSFYRKNGTAIHHGNLVLGRLALRSGDVDRAKGYLIEAGKSSGSPFLNSGGPNMMLAKELLELGEREAVIQYVRLCANFWQTRDHRAEQWIYTIEEGSIPDFGPNLNY